MTPWPHVASGPQPALPWRAQVGTYALILSATTPSVLQIGRLGPLLIQAGFYIYVGSAFGPGGLQARLAHHCRRAARPHWHIDYVRAVVPLSEVWYTYDTVRREHDWALAMQRARGASIPLPRFGASDCTCAAHFFACPTLPAWRAFQRRIQQGCPAHAPMYRSRLPIASAMTDTPYGKRLQA
ncbi:MAG: DUF123 domain-containing protein [Candidatus Tectimicrobiota bacterium]